MRRTSGVAALAAVLILASACTAPPVRTTDYRRVLIVADSLFHGAFFIPGGPTLLPELGPLLAARGIDVRLLGGSAQNPVEGAWPRQVRDAVRTYDPDLVIVSSMIPEYLLWPFRDSFVATWGWIAANAAAQGADVWRVVPPEPLPGTRYALQYGPWLPSLRDLQARGMAAGAKNRTRTIDLGGAFYDCPGGQTPDGYHLNAEGQRCAARLLYRLITGSDAPTG